MTGTPKPTPGEWHVVPDELGSWHLYTVRTDEDGREELIGIFELENDARAVLAAMQAKEAAHA